MTLARGKRFVMLEQVSYMSRFCRAELRDRGFDQAHAGDLLMAFTLSPLEPTVQAVAFFCHEKVWERLGRTPSAPVKAATAPA